MATYGTGTYGSGTYGTLFAGPFTYDKTGVAVARTLASGVREGGAPVSPTTTLVRERPPLRVTVGVETPNGKHYRWAEDESDPVNVPLGLRWSDTMPGGFESFDCTLPRQTNVDYSDLEPLSTITVRGASGDIAGEYRLERSPRTSGDQVSISPGAVGWQAHLEDDKSAMMAYRDVDLSHWGGPSIQRRLNLIGAVSPYATFDAQVEPDASTGVPAVKTAIQGPWTNRAVSPALYDTGGSLIGRLAYGWKIGPTVSAGGDPNFNWYAVGADDDTMTTNAETTGDLQAAGPGSGLLTFASAKRFLEVFLSYEATAGIDGLEYPVYWTHLAAYGDHGLTIRGTEPDAGLYSSDVVTHAVSRWAPMLNIDVQQSGFIVPHIVFLEPTTVGEIVRQATRFGLQDWGVWDNRTFRWHERGAFSKLWRSRVAPAQLDETGPQVDRLWESIIVQYQDTGGSTRTVGPPGSGAIVEDASLKDDDPDNPANQLGIIRRDILSMGTSTSAGAIEVGRRFLEESKLLDRSGRARIVGHVEDDHGVLHPYWRPRAGDYISFTDAADTSYRRIVKTDKDHSSRTCNLDLDAPPEGLKALLERLGVVLVPLGLS